MKTLEINIIKKNRKYFKIAINNYTCKLLIDDNSQNLDLGIQTLVVEDISVVTKFGTDVIYKVAASIEEQKNAGITTIHTPFYNVNLIKKCRNLGGQWDKNSSSWVFSTIVEDEIEQLNEIWNSELITVNLKFENSSYGDRDSIYFKGFVLAKATSRDSKAVLGSNVLLIEGKIGSGGSVKNWTTNIHPETILRLQVPKLVLTDKELKELEETNFIVI
ncbi:MAG: hypothetical protein NTW78_12530 [Campylobacterales bacterium]|nr:hypothetical protein [Campylobacterales bacterium]